MAEVYLYIVTEWPDPDGRIPCAVPYRVDDREIFFGPCKKRLRQQVRNRYLSASTDSDELRDDIYVAGFSGANDSKVRKVVWAGRLTRVMTFSRAWDALVGGRYKAMRAGKYSPLHVRPIKENGRLVGYKHINRLHTEKDEDEWVADLAPKKPCYVTRFGDRLLLKRGVSAWRGFPRDACLLLENIFFANGRGLQVDGDLLSILKMAQPDRDVDRYAVFGYQSNGHADGRTGNYLPLTGEYARRFIHWLQRKRPRASLQSRGRRKSGVPAAQKRARC